MKAFQIAIDGQEVEYSILENLYKKRDRKQGILAKRSRHKK